MKGIQCIRVSQVNYQVFRTKKICQMLLKDICKSCRPIKLYKCMQSWCSYAEQHI